MSSIPLKLSLFLLCAVFAQAQITQSVTDWLTSLQKLEKRLRQPGGQTSEELASARSTLQTIRQEIEDRSPAIASLLPSSADPSTDRQALLNAVVGTRRALEDSQRRTAEGVFNLGRIEVNVTAQTSSIPTVTTVEESEYRQKDLRVITDALNLVPGVSVQRIGPRNEGGVFIRGFDVRQVPLCIDGIPVYVPYDGYVDMDRFLTYDVSEVEVSKGFTSPLYGPNAIGGAVNLITKAPTKTFHSGFGSRIRFR